jgi:hypothetical protein
MALCLLSDPLTTPHSSPLSAIGISSVSALGGEKAFVHAFLHLHEVISVTRHDIPNVGLLLDRMVKFSRS